jgi:hypothetical protein
MIRRLLVAGCLLVTVTVFGQENEYTPVPPMALGGALLTLPTAHVPAEGTWEVKFTHRFNQSIDEGEAVHSLFGLDSGANVGIGLSYTPRRDLELGLLRTNILDTIELSAKYLVFQQARAVPLSAALRIGADLRTARDVNDRTSFFGQAILSRQFGEGVVVFAMPTFVSDAGRATSGDEEVALFKHAFNVPIGAAVKVSRRLSVVAEIIPSNSDLPGEVDAELGWALGIKSVVGGHFFEILLTNSNATTVDQYVTTSYQGAPLRSGDLMLGFNIERRFGGGGRR